MLVRLLLALLLASFAVPAAAAVPACHDGAVAGMAGMTGHHAPEQQASDHVCAGCVPLADWLGTRVAPRILPRDRQPDMRVIRLDLGSGVAPAVPPPRTV